LYVPVRNGNQNRRIFASLGTRKDSTGRIFFVKAPYREPALTKKTACAEQRVSERNKKNGFFSPETTTNQDTTEVVRNDVAFRFGVQETSAKNHLKLSPFRQKSAFKRPV
jgi:hypothetical protein